MNMCSIRQKVRKLEKKKKRDTISGVIIQMNKVWVI
jgi:hypothetical protein